MLNLSFKPRIVPAIFVVAGVALFVYLGMWQSGKAERRSAEIEQHIQRGQHAAYMLTPAPVNPEQLQDSPVTARGVYEPEHQFFIDNRQHEGRPGLHLVTPLRIEGGEMRVLVNRGWVSWPDRQGPLPAVNTPSGAVEVNGVATVPSAKKFFLMPEVEDPNLRLWSRLDLQRFEKQFPGGLQPIIVLQNQNDAKDTFIRKWPPPEDRVSMHKSYAMQWFGMAIALIIFFCVASTRAKGAE